MKLLDYAGDIPLQDAFQEACGWMISETSIDEMIETGILSRKQTKDRKSEFYVYMNNDVVVGIQNGPEAPKIALKAREDGDELFEKIGVTNKFKYYIANKEKPSVEIQFKEEDLSPEKKMFNNIVNLVKAEFNSKAPKRQTPLIDYITQTLYGSPSNDIQKEAANKIARMREGSMVIIDTPPGSGKTAIELFPVVYNKFNDEKSITIICTSLQNVSAQIAKQCATLSYTTQDPIRVRRCDGSVIENVKSTFNFSPKVFKNWCIDEEYLTRKIGGYGKLQKICDKAKEYDYIGQHTLAMSDYNMINPKAQRTAIMREIWDFSKQNGKRCDTLIGTFEGILYVLASTAASKPETLDNIKTIVIDEWHELFDYDKRSYFSRYDALYTLLSVVIKLNKTKRVKIVLGSATAKFLLQNDTERSLQHNLLSIKHDIVRPPDCFGRRKLQLFKDNISIDKLAKSLVNFLLESNCLESMEGLTPLNEGDKIFPIYIFPLAILYIATSQQFEDHVFKVLISNEKYRENLSRLAFMIFSISQHVAYPAKRSQFACLCFVQSKFEQVLWMISIAASLYKSGVQMIFGTEEWDLYSKMLKTYYTNEMLLSIISLQKNLPKLLEMKSIYVRKLSQLTFPGDVSLVGEILRSLDIPEDVISQLINPEQPGIELWVVIAAAYGFITCNAETTHKDILEKFISNPFCHPSVVFTTSKLGAGVDVNTAGPTFVLPANGVQVHINDVEQWLGRGFRNQITSLCLNCSSFPTLPKCTTFSTDDEANKVYKDCYIKAISSEVYSMFTEIGYWDAMLRDKSDLTLPCLQNIQPRIITPCHLSPITDFDLYYQCLQNHQIMAIYDNRSKPGQLTELESNISRPLHKTCCGYTIMSIDSIILPTLFIGISKEIFKNNDNLKDLYKEKMASFDDIQTMLVSLIRNSGERCMENCKLHFSHGDDFQLPTYGVASTYKVFYDIMADIMLSGTNILFTTIALGYIMSSSPPSMFGVLEKTPLFEAVDDLMSTTIAGLDLAASFGFKVVATKSFKNGKKIGAANSYVHPFRGIRDYIYDYFGTIRGKEFTMVKNQHPNSRSEETVASHVTLIIQSLAYEKKKKELFEVLFTDKQSTTFNEIQIIIPVINALRRIGEYSETERDNMTQHGSPWCSFMLALADKYKAAYSSTKELKNLLEIYEKEIVEKLLHL